MNKIIRYSKIIIWLILGGEKPFFKKKTKNNQLIKCQNNSLQQSPFINKRRMLNAGSNMGLMEDALEHWNRLPSKTKYKTINEWKKRYGDN